MRVLRIASPPIFLSYAVRWRTSSPGGRVCIRFVHYLLILIVSSSSTNPLKTSKEKEKNFFLPVPHQDAIPLPRLNDGPDFSSRERVCVITCPLVSLVVLRGLKSCVAGLRGIRISAIPFRRHKTRNVLGEKKTFFLTSPHHPKIQMNPPRSSRSPGNFFVVLYSEFFFGAHYFHLTRENLPNRAHEPFRV